MNQILHREEISMLAKNDKSKNYVVMSNIFIIKDRAVNRGSVY